MLLPSDPENYHRERELVPPELMGELGKSKIVLGGAGSWAVSASVASPGSRHMRSLRSAAYRRRRRSAHS